VSGHQAAEHSIANDFEPMRRAIRRAMRGRGSVEPNPMVGCVIVKDGRVIGEAHHETFGGPHAEPLALAACTESPQGASAYITLEPCCHLKKKTPPCVPKLIAARLARVVVACPDPNPMVSGRGIAQLRAAGIVVDEGILRDEARQLNVAFFKSIEHRRPYVTLKWAQSADGKVGASNLPAGQRLVISNEQSLAAAHRLRAASNALLVGIRTVLADDPLLTARGVTTKRPLLRVVADGKLQIPVSSQLTRSAAAGPVLVYCAENVYRQKYAAVAALAVHGVEVVPLRTDPSGALSLDHMLDDLGGRSITHLLVESGPTLAASFLQQNLADRVWVFRSNTRVNDPAAPAALTVEYPPSGEVTLNDNRLTEYLNPQTPQFYSLTPSADLENLKPF
jgi:diaminohydroxyphosphoribosylaminopyrimidine deaminase / 5-amino-6-(5-phosphoribosylamino)uracil reductase